MTRAKRAKIQRFAPTIPTDPTVLQSSTAHYAVQSGSIQFMRLWINSRSVTTQMKAIIVNGLNPGVSVVRVV